MDEPASQPPPLPLMDQTPRKWLPPKTLVWSSLLIIPVVTLIAVISKSTDLAATILVISPFMSLVIAVLVTKRLQVRHPVPVGLCLTFLLVVANFCITAAGCGVIGGSHR